MSRSYPSRPRLIWLVLVLPLVSLSGSVVHAQDQQAPQEPPSAQSETADAETPLSNAELEQIVAPIALHPDALLSQMLMASTYPLEVVEAARWQKANPDLKEETLEKALEDKNWDPSVKSLAAMPDALHMLNENLSWTQKLGDAFLSQQEDVLDAVQRLRQRAEKAGSLESGKEVKVKKVADTGHSEDSDSVKGSGRDQNTGTSATRSSGANTIFMIEPADPEVVYVPAYNPMVVYGTWAYPSYAPYYWYPPGYVASRALWFGAGVVAGRALWGRCDWYRRDVAINVNRYNRFNRTNIKSSSWNHNVQHRRGVSYKNRKVANKYGRKNIQNAKAREQFRGRADKRRKGRKVNRPGDRRGRPGSVDRPGNKVGAGDKRPGNRPVAGDKRPAKKPGAGSKRPGKAKPKPRPRTKAANKRPAPSKARRKPKKRPAAYRGVGNGKQTRRQSSRGKVSRSRGRGGHRGGGRRGGGRRR